MAALTPTPPLRLTPCATLLPAIFPIFRPASPSTLLKAHACFSRPAAQSSAIWAASSTQTRRLRLSSLHLLRSTSAHEKAPHHLARYDCVIRACRLWRHPSHRHSRPATHLHASCAHPCERGHTTIRSYSYAECRNSRK